MTKSSRITFITAFVLLFLAELAFGYYLSVVHGYVIGDSISRVANAFYISHSRDPHLAALGFVWNPLPSLIEWFWLLFWPLYPKLASAALAGTLTTSLFAAGTFVLLLSHCRRWGISLPFAVPFCLLYALNPFLFLYGANGMSEVMFTFFLVVVVIGLCRWLEDGGSSHTVKVGFALALAFLIRYEAIPLSAAIGFAVAIAVLFIVPVGSRAERSVLQYKYVRTEGTLIVVLAPFVYTCLIWIFMNYMIMGNPFFFFNSNYSNLSFSEALVDNNQFSRMIGNPANVLQYVLYKSSFFSVPLFIIVAYRIVKGALLRWDMLIFAAVLLSIPALQFVMLLKGTSYGWLRFFFYILPIMVAWIPYEIRKLRLNYKVCITVHSIGLAITGLLVAYAMSDPSRASEEYNTFHHGKTYNEQQMAKGIGAYINENMPDSLILMDSFLDFQVIISVHHPKNLVITSDRDFLDILEKPWKFGVEYVLVPPPVEVGLINAINQQYPSLYEHGGDWVVLDKQFDDYRKLYKVTGPPTVE